MKICINNKINKYLIFISFLLTCLLCVLSYHTINAEQEQVLKVGFPYLKGFSEINGDGTYSGYIYEYLEEIAKYTGWEYEFVEALPEELIPMLKKGEVDLLGGVLYTDETVNIYDFPEYSSGATYATLSVLSENRTYTQTDYRTFNGIVVGAAKTAKQRIKNFNDFCEINAIQAELKYYDTEEELIVALRNHEIDAILGADLRLTEDQRIIAKFAMQPYYFATTKGNYKIIRQLNMAIGKIKEVDIHFDTDLYDKYFKQESDYVVVLSDEEKEYIDSTKTLNVVSIPEFAPIQYYDSQTGKFSGVTNDIFDLITQETGLQFNFIKTKTYEEALQIIEAGKADVIAGILDDYNFSNKYNITLTEPYLNMNTVMIKNNYMDINDIENKLLAIPKGYTFNNITQDKNVLYFDTFEECIKAVDSKKADYCYANSYLVEHYTRNRHYNNISLVPLTEQVESICIGLAKPSNANLITIVNKVINSISDEKLQVILYKNVSSSNEKVTFSSFIYSNPKECIIFIILIGILIISVIIFIMRMQIKHSEQIALDGERYRILSDMSDEFIFEYDFASDSLIFSEKFSSTFGHKRIMNNYYKTLKSGNHFLIKENKMILEAFDDINLGKSSCLEFQILSPSGNMEWYRSVCTAICDNQNKPIRAIGKLICIENERKEKELLLEKSQKDSLTSIFNRAACEESIKNYLHQKDNIGALMIIDLDYFKAINDNFGHKKGDDVLKNLATTLKMIFRHTDIIGRWGGDEFVVFMKCISNEEKISEKASILCKIMDKNIEVDEKSQPISISIGIALTKTNETFTELFQRADDALYEVKRNGRNNYKINSK